LSPFERCALDFPLPGIPSDVDDSEDAELLKQPIFNFAADGEDSSSSDGSGSEQEGEYTGKFRVVHVPTKADPPTSTTRGRIEQWGRPISPFPRKGSPIPEIVSDNGLDSSSDLDLSLAQPQFHQERVEDRHVPEALEDAQEDAQVAEVTIELQGEHAKPIEITEMEHAMPSKDLAHDNLATVTSHIEVTRFVHQVGSDETHESFGGSPNSPQEDVFGQDSEPGDESTREDGNTPAQELDETDSEIHLPGVQQEDLISAEIFDVHPDNGEGGLVGEERPDEESVVRALSEEPESLTSPRQHPPEPQLLVEECIEVDEPMAEPVDAESEGDSSDESDLSVVKIVSDDPWAAARAAAILKQVCPEAHPYVFASYPLCSMIGISS
jgi:hypothetical protein